MLINNAGIMLRDDLTDPASAPTAARWRDSVGKLLERQLAQVAPRQLVSERAS
jgi:hypothetical protein